MSNGKAQLEACVNAVINLKSSKYCGKLFDHNFVYDADHKTITFDFC
jgi:hypothetical protein